MAIYEAEPFKGRYDWDEAFRQNPDEPMYDVPRWMRDCVWGEETAEDAKACALAEEAEEWLAVAHLDPGHLDGLDDLDRNDDVLDDTDDED
jgi:hypothetical protein